MLLVGNYSEEWTIRETPFKGAHHYDLEKKVKFQNSCITLWLQLGNISTVRHGALPCQRPSLVLSLIIPHSAFKRQLMFDVTVSIYKARFCPGIFWPLGKKRKKEGSRFFFTGRLTEDLAFELHILSRVTFAIVLHRSPKMLYWQQSLKAGLGTRVHLSCFHPWSPSLSCWACSELSSPLQGVTGV